VDHGDERRRGHLPVAEVDAHDDSHQRQEDHQRAQGLLTDRCTPGGADEGATDLGGRHPEGLGEVLTDGLAVGVVQALGLHPHGVVADDGDVDVTLALTGTDGLTGDVLVRGGQRGRRHPELRTTAELEPEVQALEHQPEDGDEHDDG
jgi:hypothetical protein